MKPIAVSGATGRVGSLVTSALLAHHRTVRALGRPGPKLDALARQGATPCPGQPTDPAYLDQVFDGAEAAFVMTPVDTTAADVNAVQFAVVDAVAAAIARSKIRHVVLLSSWGAELAQRVGGIIACHRFEQALDAIPDLDVVHLRPVWFMDNFLWSIPLVQMAGFHGSPIAGDVAFPMIAARDIAPVATRYLLERPTGRSTHYLCGPRDHTLVEVARALGAAIGRPSLGYIQMPEDVYRRGLLGAGLTPDAATFVIEIARGIEARVVHAPPRDPRSTTPTTLAQFAADTFAPAYHAHATSFGAGMTGTLLRAYLAVRGHRAV